MKLEQLAAEVDRVSRIGELKAGLMNWREVTKPDGSKVLRYVGNPFAFAKVDQK